MPDVRPDPDHRLSHKAPTPIAIVGVGCRFPGAPDFTSWERFLLEGRSAVGDMPADRFDAGLYFDPDPDAYGRSYSRRGGWIEATPVDPARYGLPADEIAAADTIHLWALEVARATFENAGLDPLGLAGRDISVVLGHSRGSMRSSDLAFSTGIDALLGDVATLEAWKDVPAGVQQRVRIAAIDEARRSFPPLPPSREGAYRPSGTASLIGRAFGLRGRSMVVDAACASSMAALDIAVRALRQGRMNLVLAGGAAFTSPHSMVLFSQSRALSAEGSFPFDARANGFIASDGVGMLLLARLEDAVAQGFRIVGLLHGVGASSDGRGKGLWAPNRKGQVLALRNAYERCGVDPARIGYVEAHGTSTALGDATELEALTEFYGPHVPAGSYLPIGSVKSNIGHCREAAGVAGLLKVLVAFEHDVIPPSIEFREPNTDVDWNATPVRVAAEATPWKRDGQPRMAGIDSFGIGGLNYHVVIEEAPDGDRLTELLDGAVAPSGVEFTRETGPEPIAIVGIGCIVPGAHGPEELWKRLRSGDVAIGEIPESRWSEDVFYQEGEAVPFRTNSRRGGFITGFEPDWKRYRMPPVLVENTDPLQLMLLECAMNALADAGIDLSTADRNRIAVTVGTLFGSDYATDIGLALRAPEAVALFEAAARKEGIDPSVVERAGVELLARMRASLPRISGDTAGSASSSPHASRITTTLDLHGAVCSIDSSYASSLVALESACESLWAGQSDIQLWAGADRGLNWMRFVDAARTGILSSDGRATPFEIDANGMILGEGVAVCVLRRVSDARAAGDRIYALVRGIGSAAGFDRAGNPDAGSSSALRTAIQRAHEMSGVDPEMITAVETLPTGRRSVDAAMLDVVHEELSTPGRSQRLALGSICANVGHTQGASGSLGILKLALSLHHGELPPTPDVLHPDPELDVCHEGRSLPRSETPTRVAMTALLPEGMSYHVILESVPVRTSNGSEPPAGTLVAAGSGAAAAATHAREPLVVRAADRAGLDAQLEALLRENAQTMAPGSTRGHGPVAIGLRSGEGLVERLQTARKALTAPTASVSIPSAGIALTDYSLPGDTCFLFPGQGSQYAGMLRDVAAAYPAAARRLAEVDAALAKFGHLPLSHVMWERTEILNDVLWTQMSVLGGDLMMLEVAREHGLVPRVITGHSYGDFPALVAAGAWSLEQVVEMTVVRCDGILKADRDGGMVAVFADRQTVAGLLRDLPGYAAESNVNAPDETIVSGELNALASLLERCSAAGVTARRLPVPKPFHCELMRPASDLVAQIFRDIHFERPSIDFLSSSGARFISDPEELRTALVDQFTVPVDFIAQIEAAYATGCRRFVEVGPGSLLSKLTVRILRGRPAVVAPLNDRKLPGIAAIENALAMLRAHDAGPAPVADRNSGVERMIAPVKGEVRFFDVTGLRGTRPRMAVRPPLASTAPRPGSRGPQGGRRAEIEARLIDLVCEQSGYPRDLVGIDADLEADLGIDTVRQAQILGRVRSLYDLPTDESMAVRDVPSLGKLAAWVEKSLGESFSTPASPADAPATAGAPSIVEERLVDLVCEQSGYPRDLVDLDADLEADLGIDTVRQAQILGRIRSIYDLPADESMAVRDVPTLRHLAAYVERVLGTTPNAGPVVSMAAGDDRETIPSLDLATLPPPSAGDVRAFDLDELASRPEADRRYILRTQSEQVASDVPSFYRPARVVLIGGHAIGNAIAEELRSRGTRVDRVDLRPPTPELETAWSTLLQQEPLPDVCLLSGVERLEGGNRETRTLESLTSSWHELAPALLFAPYRMLQLWMQGIQDAGLPDEKRPMLSAMTALGGAVGTWNVVNAIPEGGAVLGLCRALRREFRQFPVRVVDVEPGLSSDQAARALLDGLDDAGPMVETGVLRGERSFPRVVPSPARLDAARLDELRGYPYVVLTGGARGITAEIAIRLAEAGVRRLHLLGSTPLSVEVRRGRELDATGLEALRHEVLQRLRAERGSVSAVEWQSACEPIEKALEIDRNLGRIRRAGAEVTYHAVDVSDAERLDQVLRRIRVDGPVQAIVHGAGFQISRGFLSKTREELDATVAPKLEGCLNLMRLTRSDPMRLFVAFGSVSGRFGGVGQADYSLASEMLTRIAAAYSVERPECRVTTFAWPAWDEVGMAVHRKTRHMLESRGIELMSVREGCDHFIREVLAATPELEVTVGPEIERLAGPAVPPARELVALRSRLELAAGMPLADAVVAADASSTRVECRMDADRDAFLLQHRQGTTGIVPGVILLELLAETAHLTSGTAPRMLENVVIHSGVRLAETRRLTVMCEGRPELDEGRTAVELRAHQIGPRGQLLASNRLSVSGFTIHDPAPSPARPLQPMARPRHSTMADYRNDSGVDQGPAGWFHGPDLRTLEEAAIDEGPLHWGRVTARPPAALRPRPGAGSWWVSTPAFDGCLALCVGIVRGKLAVDGLPFAFGRLWVMGSPDDWETCTVVVRELGHDDRHVRFDFTLFGADGSPKIVAEDYVLRTFHPIAAPATRDSDLAVRSVEA